jgi:hypothetical protein
VKERPILFSGPMVRAILEGRKTQTRRVIKPQPEIGGAYWRTPGGAIGRDVKPKYCPYGRPGDLLWVRETWAINIGAEPGESIYAYRADRERPGDWKPSIHMPRKASRLLLRITDVRVQRVQEISDAEAIAEGCVPVWDAGVTPRDAFAELWDDINAPRDHGWESNPWVWAISFERSNP